jgi:hypothetical protein
MHGVQAFANLRLGNLDKAAEAARRLTSMPNAHVQARGLAALILAACGEIDRARREITVVRRLRPSYRVSDFFSGLSRDRRSKNAIRKGRIAGWTAALI